MRLKQVYDYQIYKYENSYGDLLWGINYKNRKGVKILPKGWWILAEGFSTRREASQALKELREENKVWA